MPNPHSPTPTSTPTPKIIPDTVKDDNGLDNDALNANVAPQNQRDDADREDEGFDRVEIGDPVPEKDRTVRARDDGSDEDLPTVDDDVTVDPDRDPSEERH